MLCNSAQTTAPRQQCALRGIRHTSRFAGPCSGLCSHRRVYSRAYFNENNQRERAEEDLSPAWGEDLVDWTEEPEQLDLLDDIWYEGSERQKRSDCELFMLVNSRRPLLIMA